MRALNEDTCVQYLADLSLGSPYRLLVVSRAWLHDCTWNEAKGSWKSYPSFLCPQFGLYLHHCPLVFKHGNGRSPRLQMNYPIKLPFYSQTYSMTRGDIPACAAVRSLSPNCFCLHPPFFLVTCQCCASSSPHWLESPMAARWLDLIIPYLFVVFPSLFIKYWNL